jgi:hypothetical protein
MSAAIAHATPKAAIHWTTVDSFMVSGHTPAVVDVTDAPAIETEAPTGYVHRHVVLLEAVGFHGGLHVAAWPRGHRAPLHTPSQWTTRADKPVTVEGLPTEGLSLAVASDFGPATLRVRRGFAVALAD